MASWWEEAPKVDDAPQRTGAQWWADAPLASQPTASQPPAADFRSVTGGMGPASLADGLASADEPTLAERNREFVDNTTFLGRLRDNIRRGWIGLRSNIAAGPRMSLIEQGGEAATTGDVTLGTDPLGMPIYASQAYTPRQVPGVAGAYQEIGEAAGADLAQRLAPMQAEMAGIRQRPATEALLGADTFREGLAALLADPAGVIGDIGVPSTVQMAPALAASAVVRRPAFTAGSMGATSAINEFGAGVIGYLSDQGIDVSDPEALQAALADPELVAAAANEARVRSGIIGSVDAASGGLAGRTLVPQALARNAATREAVNVLGAQPIVQAAMGAGGEAAAQLATRGEIQPGEVLAEALGEFFMAPAEVGPFAAQRLYDAATGRGGAAPADAIAPDVDARAEPAQPPPVPEPTPADPPAPEADDLASLLLRNVPDAQPDAQPDIPAPTIDAERIAAALGLPEPAAEAATPSAPAPPPPASTDTAGGPSGPAQSLTPAATPRADAAMQNRDRSRPASVAQMQDIRRNPDPARLGFSRDANTGAPMVRRGQEIPAADLGRTDSVVMPDGRRVAVQYAVVDADAVQASHFADGQVNPAYDGAPLQALNNGRTAGLQAAWQAGNADAYRQGLADDAALHGVSPEAIAGKRQPVLVRLYDPAENLTGAESNAAQQLGLSPVEQAQTDAASLPDLSGLTWSEDGSIPVNGNAEFFRAWFRNMGDTAAATLQDAQGRPNAAAVQRLRSAMIGRAYGDERLLSAIAEDVNPDNRNILNALAQAATSFAALEQSDPLAVDVRGALVGGLELVREAANQGQRLEALLEQGDLLGRNEQAVAVARYMDANKRSASRMAAAFRAMAEYTDNAQRQAANLDVFGGPPPATVGGALNAAEIETDAGSVAEDAAGRDAGGEPAGRGRAAAGDAFALQPQAATEARQEVAPTQGGGLFGAPTARDVVDDARRRRDAERDGRTGTGRTDMAAGDGELFAGPRPEQGRVDDGAAARTVTIPYRDGDRQVQAHEVEGDLVFRNGQFWDVLRPAEGGTYRPRMVQGETPQDAVIRARREDGLSAQVAREDETARAGSRLDQVLHALNGHPERALGMLSDQEVLAVAKAMGRRRGRNQSVLALRERLAEGPRAETIEAMRPAIEKVLADDPLESFAGERAETADRFKLEEARRMIDRGVSAERVRQETGWFTGHDGKWRFEISDEAAAWAHEPEDSQYRSRWVEARRSFTESASRGESAADWRAANPEYAELLRDGRTPEFNIDDAVAGDSFALSDVLDHPRLFAAYPMLRGYNVSFVERAGPTRGTFYPSRRSIDLAVREDKDAMLSTLLHEVQHAIQHIEGFATGGSADQSFTDAIRARINSLSQEAESRVAEWIGLNRNAIIDADRAAEKLRYGLMWESVRRLIDYSVRDTPSSVFRLIRNEVQWIHQPEFRGNEAARDLQYKFHEIPRRGPKRNAAIREIAFEAAQIIRNRIPEDLRSEFKADPRQLRSMIRALSRDSSRANRRLVPRRELEQEARNVSALRDAHQYSTPYDIYRHLAGEVEARNTQSRQRMTDAERQATPPSQTQDVDTEQVIVTFGALEVQSPKRMADLGQNDQLASRDAPTQDRAEESRDVGEAEAEMYGLRDAVERAVGKGRVTFLHGIDGLPDRLRRGVQRRMDERGGRGRTSGLYDPVEKQIYLFTDVLTSPDRAVWTALHEIAGHHGLREFLGDRLNPALGVALQNPTVLAVAERIAEQRGIKMNTEKGRLLAAEEALAELAAAVRTGDYGQIQSRYGVEVGEGIRQRVERAIKNFLRRLKAVIDDLFGQHSFTDADVRGLLEAAWQAATDAPTMTVQGPDGSATLEQVVFHGTPHTVDRFSLQRIGSGEGSQSYGWGLYFASRREIAEHYRDNVIDVSWLDERNRVGAELQRAARSGDPDARAAYEAHQDETARMAEEAQEREGNLYRVDIPEDRDLLDWDKPIDQQPERVRAAIEEILAGDTFDADTRAEWDAAARKTGRKFYTLLGMSFNVDGERGASEILLAAGVPGLRYLDAGSRNIVQGNAQNVASLQRSRAAAEQRIAELEREIGFNEGRPGVLPQFFERRRRDIEAERARIADFDAKIEAAEADTEQHNYVIWDEAAISEPELLESVDYTPEQQDFMQKAGVGRDTRGTLKKAQDWVAGKAPDVRKDELIQGALNKYYGLHQAVRATPGISIENDPYIAVRQINVASTMEAVLRFGAPKMVDGALRVDRSIPGLFEALKPVHNNLPGFFGWMVARRAQLLKQQGRENLMSDADIRAGLSLRAGNEAAFDQAARDYLRMKNAILDFAEQHGGTIDPAARAAWDHAEYIPFYRDDGEGGVAGPGTRRGLSHQSSGIRQLKGGEQALRDPLQNIIQNFTRLMDSALKNRALLLSVDQLGAPYFRKAPMKVSAATIPLDQVKRHLQAQGVDQATIDAMPAAAIKGVGRMLSIEAPTGDNVVRVMRKGRPEYYEVLDPLVLRSVTALNEKPMPTWFKPAIWTKNLLTAGATSTPDFLLRNLFRDTGEAWATSKERFIPLVDTLRGAAESARMNELAQDLMMAGSYFHGGLFHQGDLEATARATRRALRKHGISSSQAERIARSLLSPKRWWDVYRAGIEASEMGSRVRLARNRLQAGGTFLEAAHEAKDFLDFQLRGDARLLQYMVNSLPFLNARLQGNYRVGRMATVANRRRAVIGRLASMALASAALYAWNMLAHRDEYEKLQDWEKDAYWHIGPGTDHHIRIPKPFELGLIAGTSVERSMAALVYHFTDGESGDRPGATLNAAWRGILETLALNPTPQIVKPVAEVYFNENTFTGRPIESRSDEFLPPAERRTPHTSDTLAAASRGMQAVMGEGATLSPKQLQHLWRGYFGGMGMYILDVADVVTRQLEGAPPKPEGRWRDIPGIGAIYRGSSPDSSSRWVDEMYELREQAMQRSQSIKRAVEAGDAARARRLQEEHGWLLGSTQPARGARGGFMHSGMRELNKATDALAQLRKADLAIYENREMTRKEKRERLDENARRRDEIARKVVREFNERRRKAGR